ncbi:MAG: hypothetical protein MUC49_13190 [Raineya sp.]|jgi:hypothetical protein|nr:hypothetical protein [Raineya sp.]
MKLFFLILFSFIFIHTQAQDTEARSRTGDVNTNSFINIDNQALEQSFEQTKMTKPVILKKTTYETNIIQYEELSVVKKEKSHSRIFKHLKKKPSVITDSIQPKKRFFQRLGCFLREPLEFIDLGVEMFELTKPPKNAFLIILYVIYIVPLFAIITVFISLGVSGLVTFILLCGLFSFLIYWGVLALIGISLGGLFLLWGVIGAFVIGLILYLLLIRLC